MARHKKEHSAFIGVCLSPPGGGKTYKGSTMKVCVFGFDCYNLVTRGGFAGVRTVHARCNQRKLE